MVDFNFDKNFKSPVIGVDEVGRGSWAGPVFAVACTLNENKPLPQNLDDSKKLSSKKRYEIFENLKFVAQYGVGNSSNFEIDNFGIVKATFLSMERAINKLINKLSKINSFTLLIDGNVKPNFKEKYNAKIQQIIKGDAISPSIAAASIIAKCKRDNFMREIDRMAHGYGFSKNMGYGTEEHKTKLLLSGPTQFHRMSFSPMKKMKQNLKI